MANKKEGCNIFCIIWRVAAKANATRWLRVVQACSANRTREKETSSSYKNSYRLVLEVDLNRLTGH